MIARSLSKSLARRCWRRTSCLNLVVGLTSSGGGGGGGGGSGLGGFGLRLATSEAQVFVHRFHAGVVQQVLAGLGIAEGLGGLRIEGGALLGGRSLLGLGLRPDIGGRRELVRLVSLARGFLR